MQAAADTLALASMEVDISNLQEGETVTVKWRGKPVFIRYRTEEEIEEAKTVNMSELRHPEADVDRAVDPKVRHMPAGYARSDVCPATYAHIRTRSSCMRTCAKSRSCVAMLWLALHRSLVGTTCATSGLLPSP
jgi:hypothetical protein